MPTAALLGSIALAVFCATLVSEDLKERFRRK